MDDKATAAGTIDAKTHGTNDTEAHEESDAKFAGVDDMARCLTTPTRFLHRAGIDRTSQSTLRTQMPTMA